MKRAIVLFLAMAMAAAIGVGCGSKTSPASAPWPDGGDSGNFDGSSPACVAYCTAVMANCTTATNSGQYDSIDACLGSCATFPPGTAADQTGNTLGCRTYHAGLAKTDSGEHCPAAGPGGDGVCGANCDGYCQIALTYCTEANNIYNSLADCQASCAKAAADIVYSTVIVTGDHVACLLNHAQAAAADPDEHCLCDLAKDTTQPMVASRTCR